ncbi:MAG: hypothetical protein ACYDBB_07375 [Armatimonadota bacterium]
MKTTLTLVMTAVLFTLATTAFAYPTLTGPTGLVALPNGEVVQAGQVQLTADFYNTQDTSFDMKDTVPIRLLYGIAPNLEVGIDASLTKAFGDDANSFGANIKYQTPFALFGAPITAGAIYAQTQNPLGPDDITTWQAYLVHTRELLSAGPFGLKGTVGVNWTNLDTGLSEDDAIRAIAGAEFSIDKLAFVAEIQSAKTELGDAKPLTSFAVRYPFTATLMGQIGYTNAGVNNSLSAADEHNIFAGLSYTWGGTTK